MDVRKSTAAAFKPNLYPLLYVCMYVWLQQTSGKEWKKKKTLFTLN